MSEAESDQTALGAAARAAFADLAGYSPVVSPDVGEVTPRSLRGTPEAGDVTLRDPNGKPEAGDVTPHDSGGKAEKEVDQPGQKRILPEGQLEKEADKRPRVEAAVTIADVEATAQAEGKGAELDADVMKESDAQLEQLLA